MNERKGGGSPSSGVETDANEGEEIPSSGVEKDANEGKEGEPLLLASKRT